MEPALSLNEAKAVVATKTAPKVTEDSIKAKIADVAYLRHKNLTIAVITMANGFMAVGKAAAASPENHDPAVGERFAYEDAFRQLWPLEGYALREQLATAEATAPQPAAQEAKPAKAKAPRKAATPRAKRAKPEATQ